MNIIQLITAFGGGMLGSAIGGVPAFVFTGLTVIIAIFAGESGMPVIGTLSFGSVFGPHVAFGGAVAAAALAKKKGLVENGQDLSVPLFSTGDSSVLLVGGVFGIVGFVIQYIYSKLLGGIVFGLEGWSDTVALTVFTSGLIARVLFTDSGILGNYTGNEKRSFFPDKKRTRFLATVGLCVGIVISGVSISFGQLAMDGSKEALYLFQNMGNIGFALAAMSLAFACAGLQMESWHHTAVTSGTTAMILFAGTTNIPLTILGSVLVAIVISVACECAALTFNSYADSHIDPPATVIMLMQIINLSVLQTILPSVIG